jgi:Cu+-exporting ATPase
MLAKIVQTVNDAQSSKPPIQHLADRISSIFVPAILVIAVLAFVGWFLYTGDVQKSLLIMVATIVIACPCAM